MLCVAGPIRERRAAGIYNEWRDPMADLTASSAQPTVTFDDTDLVLSVWRHRADGNEFWLQYLSGSTWLTKTHWTTSAITFTEDLVIDKSTPRITFDTGSTHDYVIESAGSALSVKEDSTAIASFAVAGSWLKTEGNIDLHFGASTETSGVFNLKRTDVDGNTRTVLQVQEDGDVSFRFSPDSGAEAEQGRILVHQDPHSAAEYDCVVETGVQGPTRGEVRIDRCDAQNATRAGVLVLQDKNGTDYYLWVDTNGKLRIHTADPRTNDAPYGSFVVGP
jgi:hypothetical protein